LSLTRLLLNTANSIAQFTTSGVMKAAIVLIAFVLLISVQTISARTFRLAEEADSGGRYRRKFTITIQYTKCH